MSGILPDNALLLWLQDETNNEFPDQDAIAGMYSYFASGAANPLDSIKGDDRHHCFLIFQKGGSGTSVGTIVHHIAQAPSRMGTTTTYDGKWYLTAGQPIRGQQIIHEVPADLFGEAGPAQCFTPDRIQRELGNTPDATHLEFIANDANLPDLMAITTRRAMWIPNEYAALCLEDNLTPVDIWNRVYGSLLSNGHSVICSPLVQFLQYHLMGAINTNAAIFDETSLVQPRVTADFLRHRSALLSHLAAGSLGSNNNPNAAGSGAPGTGGPFGMSATQFQAFVQALRGGHVGPAPQASSGGNTAGTIDKRWNINLATLLKLTQVNDINLLPPIWGAIAKGPRKEERNILQAALDSHAHTAGAATNAKLTVTKELLSTIVNLTFWSGDFDMLSEGLHPYRTVYVSAAKQAQDQANLQTYDSLARDGSLRLEDLQLFQLALKSHWPTDFLQLDTSLKLFHNLLLVILPRGHPLVVSYDSLLTSWKGMHILFAEYFSVDKARPAQFLRSLQLRVALYWQAMAGSTPSSAMIIPPPNFQELLMSVSLQTWIPPSMPGQVAPLRALSAGGSGGIPPNAPAMGHVPSPSPAPAPAPAPAPPTGTTTGDGTSPQQHEVRNSGVLPDIASAMNGRSFQLRTLFGRGRPPPQHADGRPMCCTYHLRGRCSNTCSRAYSHRVLTAPEQETLRTFVTERIVTPNVGRDATGGAGGGGSS